jgi:hypothetical protein
MISVQRFAALSISSFQWKRESRFIGLEGREAHSVLRVIELPSDRSAGNFSNKTVDK